MQHYTYIDCYFKLFLFKTSHNSQAFIDASSKSLDLLINKSLKKIISDYNNWKIVIKTSKYCNFLTYQNSTHITLFINA